MRSKVLLLTLFFLIIISASTGVNQTNQEYRIEKPANFDGSIHIEARDNPEFQYDDNFVLASYNIEVEGLKNGQTPTLVIPEKEKWYTNGISKNSISGFKGENVEFTNTLRRNSSFEIPISESNDYYLISLNSTSTWNFYTNREGKCRVVLNPDETETMVKKCSTSNFISSVDFNYDSSQYISIIILSAAFLLFASYYMKPKIRTKIILRRNDKITEKALDIDNNAKRNKILSELMDADQKALEGEYQKSKEILNKISKELDH